jgi:hypothetical protein
MVVVPALLSETAPQILAPKGARVTLVASLFSHATPPYRKGLPASSSAALDVSQPQRSA